jgi:hypothetical protein
MARGAPEPSISIKENEQVDRIHSRFFLILTAFVESANAPDAKTFCA